jgi:hypothetical protein
MYETGRVVGSFDENVSLEAIYCDDFKDKANFEEVVRCKDCAHLLPEVPYGGGTYIGCNVWGCGNECHSEIIDLNDFCSYGMRKKGDTQ